MSNAVPIPRRWELVLLSFAANLACLATSGWLIISPDFNILKKFIGVVCCAIFGFFAILAIYRMIRGHRLYIGESGFGFGTRHKQPRLIPWSDVEGLSIYRMGRQAFVVATLSNYTGYLSQFTDSEAHAELARFKIIAGMGQAIQPFTDGPQRAELDKTLSANGSIRTLADKMAHYRAAYGGEILLSMYDRDRDPEAFIHYMTDFWERCRTPD